MRLAVGGFALEAVTFLPGETSLQQFEATALRGQALIDGLQGTSSVGGGILAACREGGVEPVPLVYTDGDAGPVASEEAFLSYLHEMAEGLLGHAARVDGLVLFLHGALVTPAHADGETEFLRHLRQHVGDALPIALAMDLHGNLSPEMLAHAQIVCGYTQSPHLDQAETGARATRLLLRSLRGEIVPIRTLRKAALVLPSIFTATAKEPLASVMARAREWEASEPDVLDVSVFTGFAYADVPQIGFSVVVMTNNDAELGEQVADDLVAYIGARKAALYGAERVWSVAEALEHAQLRQQRAKPGAKQDARPLVLLEHADRANDSTYLLRALAESERTGRPVGRVAVPYLCDPESVGAALAAGVGASVALNVGGKSSPQAGGPVPLACTVRFAGDKSYVGTGPMRLGRYIELGPTAVVEAGSLTLVLTSRSLSAIDTDPFVQFGLDPLDYDVIVLRSKTHFRAVYEPLAEAVLMVDTPDWGPADLTTLPYTKARRGVFPITLQP